MRVAILQNEDKGSANKWKIACEKENITCDVIDITASDWLEKILLIKYDFLLSKPPGLLTHYKTMYDERLYIISKVLKIPVYPTYEECFIYENKKLLSYFLKANNIPHPSTQVFYSKEDAVKFTYHSNYPFVGKTSIGASGSGVTIIKNKKTAKKYILKAFSKKGIKRRFGPNRVTGSPKLWLEKAMKSPKLLLKKIKEYLGIYKHGERDFVIFQEFVPHEFEWRVVRIGESYFAHKKIKYKEKASGSKGIEYVNPPFSILNFSRELCEKHQFNFMALDIFEDSKSGFLVNEMQTIFGHVQDYILAVDGEPGRYIYKNNSWIFEPGDFNTNESYDLRLKTALELHERSK